MEPKIIKSFTVTKGDLYCSTPFIKNTYVAGGTSTGTVMLFPFSSEIKSRRLIGHKGTVTCMCVSKNPLCLVTGGDDGTVRLWQIRGNDDSCIKIDPNDGPIKAIDISTNASRLLIAGQFSNPTIWDPFDKSVVATLPHHDSEINAVAINALSQVAVTGCADGNCHIHDSITGQLLRTVVCYAGIRTLSINEDGTKLAIGTAVGSAYLVDVQSGNIVSSARIHNQDITSLMIQPAGNLLLTGSTDGSVILTDLSNFEPIFTLSIHKDKVIDVRFSIDGLQFTTCSADRKIFLWTSPDLNAQEETAPETEIEEDSSEEEISAQKVQGSQADSGDTHTKDSFNKYIQTPSPVKRFTDNGKSPDNGEFNYEKITSQNPRGFSDLSEASTSSLYGQFGMAIRTRKKKQDPNDPTETKSSAKKKSKNATSFIKEKPKSQESVSNEDEYHMLLRECSNEMNNIAKLLIEMSQKLKINDERIARIEAVQVARAEIARKKASRRTPKK